jgi:coniferyl-aldehyde dehydrogenase
MGTTHERVDGAVDAGLDPLRAILERQRQAFVAEGPPSVAVRRHRIDRLLALVLDNADEFVDAMKADFGARPKAGSLFTEVLG